MTKQVRDWQEQEEEYLLRYWPDIEENECSDNDPSLYSDKEEEAVIISSTEGQLPSDKAKIIDSAFKSAFEEEEAK